MTYSSVFIDSLPFVYRVDSYIDCWE